MEDTSLWKTYGDATGVEMRTFLPKNVRVFQRDVSGMPPLQYNGYMLSLAHHVSNKEKADNHQKEPKP